MLSANPKSLKYIPKSNKKYKVIPISGKEWNLVTFYAFLNTIDPQIYQTSFKRGKKGNYNSYGECHTCEVQLYRIMMNISQMKIKFILYNVCEQLQLRRSISNGHLITPFQEFQFSDIIKNYDSPSNIFLDFISTFDNLPIEVSSFISKNIIMRPKFRIIQNNALFINFAYPWPVVFLFKQFSRIFTSE